MENKGFQRYDTTATYVVVKQDGGGVMGSPYYDIGVVFESENEQAAKDEAQRLNLSGDDFHYFSCLNFNSELGKIQVEKNKIWYEENKHRLKNEMSIEVNKARITGSSQNSVRWNGNGYWEIILENKDGV